MSEPVEARRAQLERGIWLGLALVAALIGVTCASRGQLENTSKTPVSIASAAPPSPAVAARAAVPTASAPKAEEPAPEAAPAAGVGPSPEATDPAKLDLPHFYADLAGLEQHKRKAPVRVLWLGDSHTAADYLTGALRARLQTRFGAAGPGFVRLGVKPYRHSQVHWACD